MAASAAEIAALVRERVAEVLDVDERVVEPTARLRDDLGGDDLALLDLVEMLEDELGERTVGQVLADDELAELLTVADVIDAVAAALERSPEPGS